MKKIGTSLRWSRLVWAALCCATGLQAASVGPSGYTNDFSSQPSATDWSFFAISGAAADIATAAALDAAVQAVAASSINTVTLADAGDPPVLNGSATWSSTGFYLQTRPTGIQAQLLMVTLVNNLGSDAASVTISYNFAKQVIVSEEIEGHRAFYSLTGAAGSWINIPEFSSAAPGRLTVTLNVSWPNASKLYVVWADDNGAASPDTACQIDNFSATAISAAQVGAAIPSPPQNQTVT